MKLYSMWGIKQKEIHILKKLEEKEIRELGNVLISSLIF